jgi:hypothetical protein
MQDRDNAAGALAADKAIVQSNEGNVARLEQLQSYEKVLAPFDGIITARDTDIGALIDAGANSPSKELFHLAAIDRLRKPSWRKSKAFEGRGGVCVGGDCQSLCACGQREDHASILGHLCDDNRQNDGRTNEEG